MMMMLFHLTIQSVSTTMMMGSEIMPMMMMITMEFMIYKMLSHLIQLSKKIRMEMELVIILIQIIIQTDYQIMFFYQANFFHLMEMV